MVCVKVRQDDASDIAPVCVDLMQRRLDVRPQPGHPVSTTVIPSELRHR